MSNISIAVKTLKIGHYVHLPLGWVSHPFVLNSFLVKDEKQLSILQNLGLEKIVVDVERSQLQDFDIGETAMDESRAAVEHEAQLRDAELAQQQAELKQLQLQKSQQQDKWWQVLRQTRTSYQDNVSKLQEIYSKVSLQPNQALESLEQLSGTIINHAEQDSRFGLALCNNPISGDLLYQNALNVAVISAKLAISLGQSRSECGLIIQTALLSNYGLLWVPESIRNRKIGLSKPEINYMKQHPVYAKQKLQDIKNLSETVITSIAQLHEKLDGSGFPKGLKGAQILPQAQLVGAASRYNDMCNGAFNCQRNSPHQVVALLFKFADKLYAKQYIEQLVSLFGLYPAGTVLQYDDQQLSQVQINIKGSLKQPLIMSMSEIDEAKRKPRLFDLTDNQSATVTPLTTDSVDAQYLEKFNLKEQYNVYYAIE